MKDDSSQPRALEYASFGQRTQSCFLSMMAIIFVLVGLSAGLLALFAHINAVDGGTVSAWVPRALHLLVLLFAFPGLVTGLWFCGLHADFTMYTIGVVIGQVGVYWLVGALIARLSAGHHTAG